MKNLLKLFVLTFALGTLVACGGSNDNESNPEHTQKTPDNGAGSSASENPGAENPAPNNPLPGNPDPDPTTSNPDPAPGVPDPQPDDILSGITGSVNTTRYQYLGDLRFTTHGDKRSINVVNIDDDADSWTIALFNPEEGTYSCEPDSTVITLARGITMLHTNADTGSCSITITSSDSIGLEGVFTATLVDVNDGTPFRVTDGTFKVVFEDAILDLDHDGISDAEDNCPFNANPDQLDDDQNRVGNICEA